MIVRALLCVAAVAMGVLASPAMAQDQGDSRSLIAGRITFQFSCAVCHGADAKGNGAGSSDLTVPAPDLTRLSARYGGTFPKDYVRRVITDGAIAAPHGGQMPAWGLLFLRDFQSFTLDSAAGDAKRVQRRIDDVTAFLESIQDD